MENELDPFKNELTDHTVAIKTGPEGWFTELICPDDCPEIDWHQDDWENNGPDSITSADEEVVIGIVPVNVELEKGSIVWFRPVVPEGE